MKALAEQTRAATDASSELAQNLKQARTESKKLRREQRRRVPAQSAAPRSSANYRATVGLELESK